MKNSSSKGETTYIEVRFFKVVHNFEPCLGPLSIPLFLYYQSKNQCIFIIILVIKNRVNEETTFPGIHSSSIITIKNKKDTFTWKFVNFFWKKNIKN